MVRADFYNGPKSVDLLYPLQGSVSMDIPRITSRFMKNVLLAMRMVECDKIKWCYLYVDGKYVGVLAYDGMMESFHLLNSVSDKVYRYNRRRVPYDRQAS